MLSICSECSKWLLTLSYEPKFCSNCGGVIGSRFAVFEWLVIAALAVGVIFAFASSK